MNARAGRPMVQALLGLVSWTLLIPARLVIPRRRDWVAVLGRGDGNFIDNCKYFYIAAQDSEKKVVFVSRKTDVITILAAAGMPVVRYPSVAGAWFLLRAGAAVVDTTEWSQRGRRALLSGSRIVQLWHGVGFKRIELDRWWHERSSNIAFQLRKMIYWLSGRLVRYDTVLSTSMFYGRELFSGAFLSRSIVYANYPRNVFGHVPEKDRLIVNVGVDRSALHTIQTWRAQGKSIVFVAPTFRDGGDPSVSMDTTAREFIRRFCTLNDIRLVFKLHPLDSSKVDAGDDIALICEGRSDVYPLLRYADALVTDYSSIYMDFLVLDRPVFFHVPDIAAYLEQRDIQFDFDLMTPGPKSTTWQELFTHVTEQLKHDTYSEKRHHIRSVAFDTHDPKDATAAVLRHLARKR